MLRCLLHCVLALALALAGVGNAVASVSMLSMDAAPLADAHAMHEPATAPHAGHAAAPDMRNEHSDCGTDCCAEDDADGCHCSAMHLVQDIALPVALPSLQRPHLPLASRPAYGHPAPLLRDNIRPPIGQA